MVMVEKPFIRNIAEIYLNKLKPALRIGAAIWSIGSYQLQASPPLRDLSENLTISDDCLSFSLTACRLRQNPPLAGQ